MNLNEAVLLLNMTSDVITRIAYKSDSEAEILYLSSRTKFFKNIVSDIKSNNNSTMLEPGLVEALDITKSYHAALTEAIKNSIDPELYLECASVGMLKWHLWRVRNQRSIGR